MMFEILVLMGLVMIIGFAVRWAFEKTRIPEVIILMLLGFLLGPLGFLSYFTTFTITSLSPEHFRNITPVIGAIAIVSLVFEAGLRLDIEKLFRNISFSTVFAFANIMTCIGILTSILYFGFGWGLAPALLLGAILGGPSSFTIYSILPFVRTSNYSRGVLYLEGTLSTILMCVVAITVMRYTASQTPTAFGEITRFVISSFSISFILGLVLGLVILWALFKFKIKKFAYLLILSSLFILYYVDFESLSGIGVISIVVIGFILGNSSSVFRFLKMSGSFEINQSFRAFQEEISLFINTFFFVYMGMIARTEQLTDYTNLKIVLFLVFGILVARSIVILITRWIGHSQHHEDMLLGFMVPRDLLSATLATFMFIPYGTEVFSIEIVLMVIGITAVITSMGVSYYERRFRDTLLFKKEVALNDGRNITIRTFTKDDFRRVRQFLNDMVKEGALISIDKYVNPVEEKDMGKESMIKINKGEMILWIGEYGKKIVARASAEKMPRRERENVSLSLYVSKEFRGAGLGKTLLTMLIEESQRVFKPHNLYLTVYSNNDSAIKLYEKQGFKKVGILPGWIKHQDGYLDRIYMVYRSSEHQGDKDLDN